MSNRACANIVELMSRCEFTNFIIYTSKQNLLCMGITESSMKKDTLDEVRAINRRMWEITYILNYLKLSSVVITLECPEMAASDVDREGLVVPIALIGFRERATSLIMDTVLHVLEIPLAFFTVFCVPVRVYGRWLIPKQLDSLV